MALNFIAELNTAEFGTSSLRSLWSQTPFFISPRSNSGGFVIDARSGGHFPLWHNGFLLYDFGSVGPSPDARAGQDFLFVAGDFPLTLSAVRLDIARTGNVGTESVIFALWNEPNMNGTPLLSRPPDAFATFAAASLDLVNPADNYSANLAPIVPRVERALNVPLVFTAPSVLIRAIYLDTGYGSVASNIVLGTSLASIDLSVYTYTTDSPQNVYPELFPGALGLAFWGDRPPSSYDPVASMRNPSEFFGFVESGTATAALARSTVQFVG